MLVFEKEPALKIKGLKGAVSVYNLYPDSNKIAFETSDIDKAGEFYPEHGQGYILKQGDLREVFWVFEYDSLRVQLRVQDNAVTAELTCENTVLTIDGNIPPLQYHNQNGRLTTYPRMCRVEYTDAMWSDFYKPHRMANNPLYNNDCIYNSGCVRVQKRHELSRSPAQRRLVEREYSHLCGTEPS